MNTQDKLELTELIARYKQRSIGFNEYGRLITLLLAEHDETLTLESKIIELQSQLDDLENSLDREPEPFMSIDRNDLD